MYTRIYEVLYTAENKNQQMNTKVLIDKFWVPFKPHLKILSLDLSQKHRSHVQFFHKCTPPIWALPN